MSYQVSKMSDKNRRLYLTLLAHADNEGLVTQCSWVKMMDYAMIEKQSDAQDAIKELESLNVLRTIKTATRSPHFQILGNFKLDLNDATNFTAANMARVNTLQSERSKVHQLTKKGRTLQAEQDVVIESLEEIVVKNPDIDPKKWRFSIRFLNKGLLRNCIYIAYDHKEHFLAGPGIKTRDGWLALFDFEPLLEESLRNKINKMIDGTEL